MDGRWMRSSSKLDSTIIALSVESSEDKL